MVGDDDQSIYSFRGASIQNLLNFEKDFAGAEVVRLEQNYRSTSTILDLSHAVIVKNKSRKDKKLWTDGPDGDKAVSFVGDDEGSEAAFIASEIIQLKESGVSYRDIGILYRTNAQSRAIEEALIEARVPYRIFGGLKFYERKEIKDILAYVRLLMNEHDNQAFQRVVNTPPRGIGPQTLRQITEKAAERGVSLLEAAADIGETNNNVKAFVNLVRELQSEARRATLSSLLEVVIEKSDYGPTLRSTKDLSAQSRIENLAELVSIGRTLELQHEEPLAVLREFLDRVALTSSAEDPTDAAENQNRSDADDTPNAVSLMTLHLAKGLEFERVFLTGIEEGLLPHYRSLMEQAALEEERRLLYVGITRAKKRLYLTRAVTRGMFSGKGLGGGGVFRTPSRFTFDFPAQLLEMRGENFLAEGSGGITIEREEWNSDATSVEEDQSLRSFFVKRSKKQKVKKEFKFLTADELLGGEEE